MATQTAIDQGSAATSATMSPAASDYTLSVIVPVFNERVTLRQLVERVRAVPIRKEILIVDDGSNDGTAQVVRDLIAAGDDPLNRLRAFFHERNMGKGAALRTAMPAVSGDVVVIQDADLEYNPNEYVQLVEPILSGRADVVYGSRFLGGPRRVLFFRHTVGNRLLTFLSNLCTDLNLTDMETCYKAFRSDVFKRLHLVSNRFTVEPEITAKVARMGCRLYEVPISYHGREYWEGKKTSWRDGLSAIWTILRYSAVDDKENTDPGYKTLQRLRTVRRYNEWVWGQLVPYVGDRVLEIGSGVGSFTQYLRNREWVVATDNNPDYLNLLGNRFARWGNVEVRQINWERPDIAELRSQRFDTILCLNVLEHIENDDGALATFAQLLEPGGRLVLQVPAMSWLYGEIDRAIGHVRRYQRAELMDKLRAHGFEVDEARYFNLPGVIGWFLNAVLLRRRTVPGVQARLANLLVPLLRLERRWQLPCGMALIAVGRKVRAIDETASAFVIPDRCRGADRVARRCGGDGTDGAFDQRRNVRRGLRHLGRTERAVRAALGPCDGSADATLVVLAGAASELHQRMSGPVPAVAGRRRRLSRLLALSGGPSGRGCRTRYFDRPGQSVPGIGVDAVVRPALGADPLSRPAHAGGGWGRLASWTVRRRRFVQQRPPADRLAPVEIARRAGDPLGDGACSIARAAQRATDHGSVVAGSSVERRRHVPVRVRDGPAVVRARLSGVCADDHLDLGLADFDCRLGGARGNDGRGFVVARCASGTGLGPVDPARPPAVDERTARSAAAGFRKGESECDTEPPPHLPRCE
ncbi:MAG: glycosyltransferase [Deltaproteobacteria bacterium]|nr:glycosyltransferase [Deltaproteobacteria bacterium]